MEANKKNTIRPVKIRIVNPTPKLSQTLSIAPEKDNVGLDKLQLLFFIVIACLVFFILDFLKVWNYFLIFSSAWKNHSLYLIFSLIIIFIIPTIIYIFIKPETIHLIDLRINLTTAIFSFLIGLPLAYMLGLVNSIVSIFATRVGLTDSYWLLGSELQYFPNNSPLYTIVFLLVICILPAIIIEINLRSIFLSELLTRKRQRRAILYSSALTALLMFQWSYLIPYFGLGLLLSLLFIYNQSVTGVILCHLSFNLSYHYLMVRVPWLSLNQTMSNYRAFESLMPVILKGLLATCLFVPLFVVLSQMKQMNPLLQSDEIIARHTRKKEPGNTLLFISLVSLVVIFIAVS